MATPKAPSAKVHTIKVTLAGSAPPIWRRLQVPSAITLSALHDILQASFGWDGYHLWLFETRLGRFGPPFYGLEIDDASVQPLGQVAPRKGSKLRYTYDLGDSWEHFILVEAITSPESDVTYPRCLTGGRACPPEDCGGIWGYDSLLKVLSDPGHEGHRERLEWLGLDSASQFDPAAFDLDEVNAALADLTAPRARN
jgi:hypothetical protein